jgi:hypothetical protein
LLSIIHLKYTSDFEHLFMCSLAIYIVSLAKCPFTSIANF